MSVKNETGKSRIIDITTSMNNGYIYDMPVARHTLKSYTTFIKNTLVLNISDEKICEWGYTKTFLQTLMVILNSLV